MKAKLLITNSMTRPPGGRGFLLIVLACFPLSPSAPAVARAPDADYASNNTTEETGAPFTPIPNACDTVSFTPAQYFPTGGFPMNVLVADFTGDGSQDFAVNNDSDVIIYFGDGRGGFGAPETLSLGGYHQGLATGDFNSDGKPDLAVTNLYDQTVSILLNDGSGGFSAPFVFPTGANAAKVAVGDFNNNNKLDLAIITGGNTVTILLGHGDGQFGPPTSYPAPRGPVDLTVADFNNDGALDVAVSTYDSTKVKILLGDGQGHFTGGAAYTLDGNSFAIASGDFNGDGNIDVAAGVDNIYPNNHVAVFIGDGTGAFTLSQKVYVPGPAGLTTGDFNGDGNLDFAAANYGFSTVSLALGDGSGQFGAPHNVLVAHPRQYVFDVATADFNADDKPDLVTADYEGNGAAVLLNLPSVKIVAADASALEPGTDTGKFRVTRTGCTGEPLLVHYAVSGTTPGVDYTRLSGAVTIPPGKMSAAIEVVPLDDFIQEPAETVTATLSDDPAYHTGGQNSAVVTINDND